MNENGQTMDLMSLLPEELEALCASLGQPRYRAKQIFTFLSRGVWVDEMSSLPKDLRAKLSRIAIGDITLGELPSGKWRYLSENEIKNLKK